MTEKLEKNSLPLDKSKLNRLSLAKSIFIGAVTLFGVSGILYGVGFLVLRSHYSFLGIWGGIPWSTTQIAEEGGRFFYHLIFIFVPASYFSSINWQFPAILLVLAVIYDVVHKFLKNSKLFKPKIAATNRSFGLFLPTLLSVIILFGTAILLETIWVVASYNDVLRSSNNFPQYLNEASARSSLYTIVVWRTFVGIFFVWILYRFIWPHAAKVQRTIILIQLLLVIVAIGMLPIAYGKLILPTSYHTVNYPGRDEKETLLLIGQTSNFWILWNTTKKQTEILTHGEKERIIIGKKQEIF